MFAVLRQRNFALLWFGGLVSMSGDWMLLIALPIYVYQLTGSTLATSTMLMVGMLPRLLLGSLAGVFVDRWDRKRTMIVCNGLLALGLLPLLLVQSVEQLWIIYIVAFVESCISQFFHPAEGALLPNLVAEDELIAANSMNALNNNLARLFGPALGGMAAGLLGIQGVALLDAASFLIAGALIALITVDARPKRDEQSAPTRATASWTSVWSEWIEGLRLVQSQRVLLVVFALLAVMSLGEGVFSVLFIVFVNKILGGAAQEIGWLMSAQAIGGLLGGLVIGSISKRIAPYRLLGISAILFGFIDLLIFNIPAFVPSFLVVVILFVIVGIPAVGGGAGLSALIQTSVADQYRGRIFGTLGMTQGVLALSGTAIAGTIGDRLGVVPVLNIQGGAYVVAGILALLLLHNTTTKAVPAVEASRAAEGI